LRPDRRAFPHCHPPGCSGVPRVSPPGRAPGRHRHGTQSYAAQRLVLGRVPRRQPDAGDVGGFQRQLGLTRYETAFGILHKLRAGMVRPDQDRIGGRPKEHVEVDETWVGGRTRGEGRGIHHKTLVAAAVEVRHRKPGTAQDKRKDGRYAGRVRLAIAADRSADSLCGFVENAVMPGSLIVTDDWNGYASLRKRGYDHHAIAESGDPEVAEQFMPMIHLVFSNLKTWLNGIHHGVSAKHLQAYLNEFTFRFNRRFYPFNAFRSLLGIAGGVEAPTYADLYSGAWTHPTCSGCLH